MAKIPLKLSEMIDGDSLRAALTALTAGSDGDGSAPAIRAEALGEVSPDRRRLPAEALAPSFALPGWVILGHGRQ